MLTRMRNARKLQKAQEISEVTVEDIINASGSSYVCSRNLIEGFSYLTGTKIGRMVVMLVGHDNKVFQFTYPLKSGSRVLSFIKKPFAINDEFDGDYGHDESSAIRWLAGLSQRSIRPEFIQEISHALIELQIVDQHHLLSDDDGLLIGWKLSQGVISPYSQGIYGDSINAGWDVLDDNAYTSFLNMV